MSIEITNAPYANVSDVFTDGIVTGLTTSVPASSLTGQLDGGIAFVNGQRVVFQGSSYSVAASSTSYLDLNMYGGLSVSTSSTPSSTSLRLWEIVSGTEISSVTQIAGVVGAALGPISQSGVSGQGNQTPLLNVGDAFSDFIASGVQWSVPSPASLTAGMSSGVAYINGVRTLVSEVTGNAFPASNDTYVSINNAGQVDYQSVANGATAPTPNSGYVQTAKIVTSPIQSPMPTLTAGTSGTLASGTYGVALVAYDATGYGAVGASGTVTVAASGSIDISWVNPLNETSMDIYATTAGGTTLGLVASGVTGNSYTYTGSTAPGAAAPTAATSNSIQDVQLLFNGPLGYFTPEMFGAVGDGVTDDTAPLQQFFDALSSFEGTKTYYQGVLDKSYAFSQTLKIRTFFGSIKGKGAFVTNLTYIGTATDIDLILVEPGEHQNLSQVYGAMNFGGFSLYSNTVMTAGAGIHFHYVGFIYTRDINLSPQYANTHNLWDGVFYDSTDYQLLQNFYIQTQNSGIVVAGGGYNHPGPQYDLYVTDGKVASCGKAGIHIGGGWDGANFDNMVVVENGTNVLIDNSIYKFPNQEILFGPIFYTNAASSGDNYTINDTLNTLDGGYSQLMICGEITGAKKNGINIISWGSYMTVKSPYIIYNDVNGILIQDSNCVLSIDASCNIANNASYGIQSTASTLAVNGTPLLQNNNNGGQQIVNVYLADSVLGDTAIQIPSTTYTLNPVAKKTFVSFANPGTTLTLGSGVFDGQEIVIQGYNQTTIAGSLGTPAGYGYNQLSFSVEGGGLLGSFIWNSGNWQFFQATASNTFLSSKLALTIFTSAGDITASASQLVQKYIAITATQTSDFTITTDTATNIVNAVENCSPQTSFIVRIINNDQSSTGYTASLAGGTGVTISTSLPNPAIPKGGFMDYLFHITSTLATGGSSDAVIVYPVGGNSAGLL